jgi:hypothetical protein
MFSFAVWCVEGVLDCWCGLICLDMLCGVYRVCWTVCVV